MLLALGQSIDFLLQGADDEVVLLIFQIPYFLGLQILVKESLLIFE